MNGIAIQDRKKPVFLTDKELEAKIAGMHFTKEEKLEDTLLEVYSYLIALRDNHTHKLSIEEVLEKTRSCFDLINQISIEVIKEKQNEVVDFDNRSAARSSDRMPGKM